MSEAFTTMRQPEQMLLLQLWTDPSTPLIGVVRHEPDAWAQRLAMRPGAARSAIATLTDRVFVATDGRLVVLSGYLETQLGGMPSLSVKWLRATLAALETFPDSALLDAFREHYGLPKKAAPKSIGYGIGYGAKELAENGSAIGYGIGYPIPHALVAPIRTPAQAAAQEESSPDFGAAAGGQP